MTFVESTTSSRQTKVTFRHMYDVETIADDDRQSVAERHGRRMDCRVRQRQVTLNFAVLSSLGERESLLIPGKISRFGE